MSGEGHLQFIPRPCGEPRDGIAGECGHSSHPRTRHLLCKYGAKMEPYTGARWSVLSGGLSAKKGNSQHIVKYLRIIPSVRQSPKTKSKKQINVSASRPPPLNKIPGDAGSWGGGEKPAGPCCFWKLQTPQKPAWEGLVARPRPWVWPGRGEEPR